MKKYLGAAVVLFAMAMVTGCASQVTAPTAADAEVGPAAVQPPVSNPLSVTRDEYESAYATFAECMAESGARLFGQEMVGVVHSYSYLSEQEPQHGKCYAPFAAIDSAWQLANEYGSPTQVALRDCLKAVGVDPAPTVAGVWDQIVSNKIDPVECARK